MSSRPHHNNRENSSSSSTSNRNIPEKPFNKHYHNHKQSNNRNRYNNNTNKGKFQQYQRDQNNSTNSSTGIAANSTATIEPSQYKCNACNVTLSDVPAIESHLLSHSHSHTITKYGLNPEELLENNSNSREWLNSLPWITRLNYENYRNNCLSYLNYNYLSDIRAARRAAVDYDCQRLILTGHSLVQLKSRSVLDGFKKANQLLISFSLKIKFPTKPILNSMFATELDNELFSTDENLALNSMGLTGKLMQALLLNASPNDADWLTLPEIHEFQAGDIVWISNFDSKSLKIKNPREGRGKSAKNQKSSGRPGESNDINSVINNLLNQNINLDTLGTENAESSEESDEEILESTAKHSFIVGKCVKVDEKSILIAIDPSNQPELHEDKETVYYYDEHNDSNSVSNENYQANLKKLSALTVKLLNELQFDRDSVWRIDKGPNKNAYFNQKAALKGLFSPNYKGNSALRNVLTSFNHFPSQKMPYLGWIELENSTEFYYFNVKTGETRCSPPETEEIITLQHYLSQFQQQINNNLPSEEEFSTNLSLIDQQEIAKWLLHKKSIDDSQRLAVFHSLQTKISLIDGCAATGNPTLPYSLLFSSPIARQTFTYFYQFCNFTLLFSPD
jgi:hypothetical protein